MMRNYNTVGPGPSQSSGSMISSSQMAMGNMQGYPPEPPVNLASKVAEVFLTAGHAFQKLGDLTLQLHSSVEPEECKWNEKDVDQLRDSLTRFAHELDMISQSVQGRTTKLIKTDIKRRHMMTDRPASPGVKRPIGVGGPVPTKRVNVVPSSGAKAIPVTRTVVPMSATGQRVPVSHVQMQQQSSATHLNDPAQYQYSS